MISAEPARSDAWPQPLIRWRPAWIAQLPPLRPGRVDVRCIWAPEWLAESDEIEAVLSVAERARARRFHHRRDHDRYVVQAGLLRRVLAHYAKCSPQSLRFHSGAKGKPALHPSSGLDDIAFNLSHSAGLILLAMSVGVEVGVDLEQLRPIPEQGAIADTHFTPAETAALATSPEASRTEGFYRLWTAKEAVLKATGDGISELLGKVEIVLSADGGLELRRAPSGWPTTPGWSLWRLDPAEGFIGTLAVPVPSIEVSTGWLRPVTIGF